MGDFADTSSNLLKYCISVLFLLIEGLVLSALRKERFIALFVERFKYSDFGKSLISDCASTRNNLLKHCISS